MPSEPDKRDPIALARANWERSGWGDVADGMVAVTSVMRAHQILLARVETSLRPYDLCVRFAGDEFGTNMNSGNLETCETGARSATGS